MEGDSKKHKAKKKESIKRKSEKQSKKRRWKIRRNRITDLVLERYWTVLNQFKNCHF